MDKRYELDIHGRPIIDPQNPQHPMTGTGTGGIMTGTGTGTGAVTVTTIPDGISIAGNIISGITYKGKEISEVTYKGKTFIFEKPKPIIIPINNVAYGGGPSSSAYITFNVASGTHTKYELNKELWFNLDGFVDDANYDGNLRFAVTEWLYGTKVFSYHLRDLRSANPVMDGNKFKGYLSIKWNGSYFYGAKYVEPPVPQYHLIELTGAITHAGTSYYYMKKPAGFDPSIFKDATKPTYVKIDADTFKAIHPTTSARFWLSDSGVDYHGRWGEWYNYETPNELSIVHINKAIGNLTGTVYLKFEYIQHKSYGTVKICFMGVVKELPALYATM